MSAREGITDALHRYCRGIDRLDGDLVASAYHPGGWDDHGDLFCGPVEDYVPWVLALLRERFTSTLHALSNTTVEVRGDVAHVESYLLAHHVVAGTGAVRVLGARYVDRFELRSATGWRIAHRVLVPEWQVEHTGAVALPPGAAAPARDRTDPSYAR